MEIVEANPKFQWSFDGLIQNPNLTLDFIERHLNKWNYYWLSQHRLITMEFVKRHPEAPWSYELGLNPNITMADVRDNPSLKWCAEALSRNPTVTIAMVTKHPEIRWNLYSLFDNSNITWKEIFDNPDIFNVGVYGCFHPRQRRDFGWEDFQAVSDHNKKYCIPDLCRCEDITWDIVDANPVLYTCSYLPECVEGWNYRLLSANSMMQPSSKRIQARTALIREELVDVALSPDYVAAKIERYGKTVVVENM